MMRISATTSLCISICLAACSEDSKPTRDGGGAPGIDAASPGGGTGGDAGTPGGGNAGAGGGDGGGGAAGGGDGGGGDGGGGGSSGGTGGNNDGGGDGGQQGACDPSAAPDVGQLKLETVVSGLENLVFAAQPPGSTDWWLVRQTGHILIRSGSGAPAPFLDVSSEITLTTSPIADDERGLLGLAFAPDFATSGLFYIMMTPTSGGNRDQVRQYRKEGNNATPVATLLTLPNSDGNHNGGSVVIGPDNMLYVGTGDGGGSCNSNKANAPQLISSSENALFGKILRLDPSKPPSYAAAGNPFPDSPLVWHYGLRNPFRFSFDRATGDLYIGDVGQGAYEDVEFSKSGISGLNFGWAAYEGNAMTCSGRDLRAGSMHTPPIYTADRRRGSTGPFRDWVSVIGGVVYRGSALPQLQGVYIFGDYQGARMAALRQCNTTTSPTTAIRKQCDPNSPQEACFTGTVLQGLTAIVQDNAGEVYLVADQSNLLKIVPGP